MNWSVRAAIVATGAVGTLGRTALGAVPDTGDVPLGTLAANLLGAFLLGLIVGWLGDRRRDPVWLPVTGGLLGALTTFSTFAVEVTDLTGPSPGLALAYAGGSVVAGAGLAIGGGRLGRQLAARAEGGPA